MEIIGYFEEYIINGKYIGSKISEKKNREIGYYGKLIKKAEKDIVLDNKKKIKKGQEYYTRYYPLNGKIKKI